VNYNVPGAVTVVPTREFTAVITPAIAQPADPAWLARTRPVVDPFTIATVRQVVPNIDAGRPRVGVPVEFRQSWNRALVTSQNPIVPSVAANSVKAFKVQAVPAEEGKRSLKISDSGETVVAAQANGLPVPPAKVQASGVMTDQERQARIASLSAQAAQGDKGARQEMRQLQEQQRIQDKEARKAAAQQAATGQAQQAEQRRAEKQAARQQAQEQTAQQQSEKAQRRAARPQTEQPAAQQQQKSREQRRAERQAQQQAQQQAEQQRQQQ